MANPVGFENTQDPKRAAANQRSRIAGMGDWLHQADQDRLAEEERRRNYYSNYLDPLMRAEAEGYGGYSPEEIQRILGEQGLNDLQLTEAERAANYLTPEEMGGIRGDTSSYSRYFDPDRMDQDLRSSQGRQFQAVDDLDQSLRTAVDPGRLRQSDTYRQNSRNILEQNRRGFEGTYGNVSGNVRGAIDPSAVTTSDAFLADFGMSPEEKQRLVTGAGISAGTGYRAAVGEMERRARAAGASPLAVGAYRARMERDSAAAAGDAMTQARIRADEADAARKLTGEQLRTQGGRYLTDVRTGTEMDLGRQALAENAALGEQARLQENALEQNRQVAEQYLTGANLDAARTAGAARLQNAQNVTAAGQGAREFAAETGTGIATAQDRDLAARNAAIAQNRQTAEQYNQDQRYGRGMAANTALANRAAGIGDTRLNQQNIARNYYTGQSGQANANAEAARQRQLGVYSTQTGGTNDATAIAQRAAAQPALWEKIAGLGIGALGAATGAGLIPRPKPAADGEVITEPSYRVIGEEGPEMVVPAGGYRSKMGSALGMAAPSSQQFYGEAASPTVGDGYSVGRRRPPNPASPTVGSGNSIGSRPPNPNPYIPASPNVGLGQSIGSRPPRPVPASPTVGIGQSVGSRPPAVPPASPTVGRGDDSRGTRGSVVSSPTIALLGKNEPEQVVPLSYRASARVRPSAAMGQEVTRRPRRFYGEAA